MIDFIQLTEEIKSIHDRLQEQVGRAINIHLTMRNWLIGFYITEYEQNGLDRAKYGEKIIETLSHSLAQRDVARTEPRELRRYRQFYKTYPQIRDSLSPELIKSLKTTLYPPLLIRDSASPETALPGKTLIETLSFTHFRELMSCENPVKRAFYEIECIKGCWSVSELKRQIGSLYFERMGLSENKEKLSQLIQKNLEQHRQLSMIRDPYVFEFLGLKPVEVMGESHLEDMLISKLQDFLLELGHGFCFEARQKRILIGDQYYFADLVFYHRVLKCHIIVELKLEPFNHENIGQLNTYVNWFKFNVMLDSDNPPIGILLCTDKNNALAEYALAGMDNQLFASKYLLELPAKEDIQNFIQKQLDLFEK